MVVHAYAPSGCAHNAHVVWFTRLNGSARNNAKGRSKGTLMRVSAVRVPRHRERCDSAIYSRGLTLDDCIRYDYTDRATLCHPFTTPTQPRYEDHANQNRSFAFFLFFQNRPSPFCPYLCYRFNHAVTLSPSFSFSLTIVFTKNSTLLFPSLLSPYEILLLVDARKKSKKYASSGKIGNQ